MPIQVGIEPVEFPTSSDVILHARLHQNRTARIVQRGEAEANDVLRQWLLDVPEFRGRVSLRESAPQTGEMGARLEAADA